MNKRVFVSLLLSLSPTFVALAGPAPTESDAQLLTTRAPGVTLGDSLGFSPFWDWKTIQTENFRISFDGKLELAAQKVANYLELAHKRLAPFLKWQPAWRTQVILLDNSDLANGFATANLRLGLTLYLSPPDNTSSIGFYDDWLKILTFHEYTHLLNMDVREGFWTLFRYVFGDSLRANSIWPDWMLEGLAVYVETHFTRTGRGRSQYYEMILRTAVEHKALNHKGYITLDKLQSYNPYAPGGEGIYLFGYQLMNQVAKDPALGKTGKTADGESTLATGAEALGEMSLRSGRRFPWLLNGNLENITGKTWDIYWKEWVDETNARMTKQLEEIRKEPVSEPEWYTRDGYEALGTAVSADGKWLAYAYQSMHDVRRLFLLNLVTKERRAITRINPGTGLSFTPDGRYLLFNEVRAHAQYNTYNDLFAYDVQNDQVTQLTHGLRAKDPAVSLNGQWVTFSVAAPTRIGIAIAPIVVNTDGIKLGLVKPLYMPEPFDQCGNPRYTPDGNFVVYSYHQNGKRQEDLMQVEVSTGKRSVLLANGHFNRAPVFNSLGQMFFVSNASGVDNLYLYQKSKAPLRVTNVTTGLWLPAFNSHQNPEEVYANVYSLRGWDAAKVKLAVAENQGAKVPPPPGPVAPPEAGDNEPLGTSRYAVDDYSIFPSIWPREWAPFLYLTGDTLYTSLSVSGFDASQRHYYGLLGGWDRGTREFDYSFYYQNRSLGPTLSFYYGVLTQDSVYTATGISAYNRKQTGQFEISYPFRFTRSSLNVSIDFGFGRNHLNFPGDPTPLIHGQYVPHVSGLFSWYDPQSSRWAISSERGRLLEAGARYYQNATSSNTLKGFAQTVNYFRLFHHVVFVPILAGQVTTKSNRYSDANAGAGTPDKTVFSSPSDFGRHHFDKLMLRGYPGQTFRGRAVAVGTGELRYPIARIFRGKGTIPAFLKNFYGVSFFESAFFPGGEPGDRFIPAFGTGLRLSSDILVRLPITFGVDYHMGLRSALGGTGEVIGTLSFTGTDF